MFWLKVFVVTGAELTSQDREPFEAVEAVCGSVAPLEETRAEEE